MVQIKTTRRTSGFTIVELLIAIVVIAILAAITTVAYNGIQERVRDARAMAIVLQFRQKLETDYIASDG